MPASSAPTAVSRNPQSRSGDGGVEEIVELDLSDTELTQLREAAEGIRAKCADLASL